MKIIALLPMRSGSERVPRKNVRQLVDRPLYQHILAALLDVAAIQEIFIDTDDEEIRAQMAGFSKRVNVILRPEHLRSGDTPMNDVLLHDIQQVSADYYVQTHSTNPLLRSQTIAKAIEAFLGARDKDSLFGVTQLQTRLWTRDGKPLNHDPNVLLRTQDLAPVYEENSNIYIFDKATLERRRNRIGQRPLHFEIPREEAWDIDEELDFQVAEFLMRERMLREKSQ